jgi:signal transduction histidine kinase
MTAENILQLNAGNADELYKQEELKMFYHRIIHDIKAPIASMIGLVRISKTKMKDKESQEFFNEIENYFRLLETEIFSSLKHGAFYSKDLEAVPVDFDEIIGEIQKLLSYSRSMSKVHFHRSIKQTRPFRINRQLVFSILQNIIDNALKHGRDSDSEELNIHISILQSKSSILIKVEDDGKGISENTKKKLFSNLDMSNDLLFKGNGLGLFIIRKTVEKLNGTLSIDPKETKGTRFTITLPEA